MPLKVMKLELGQSIEEYKGKEDDTKVYWKEGFRGRMHEAIKTTKERIKTHWGVPNKLYLVRRDLNLTIPFTKRIDTEILTLKNLTKEDTELIKKHKRDNPFPIEQLSNHAKSQIKIFETKQLDLCNKCKDKTPDYITVDFLGSDQLMGSTTEAVIQRQNEDFAQSLAKASKTVMRGDVFMYMIGFTSLGALITIVMFMATGMLKL
jgi:hypothetical protein